jgi:tetratricopeptide (TPR) repeat protein
MKGIIFGSSLVVLLALAPSVRAQQSQGMEALAQAMRSHDLDRGRDSSMNRIPMQTMLARVNPSTIQELEATSISLQSNPNNADLLFRRGFAAMQASDQNPVMSQGWLHFAAIDLEQSLRLNPNNWAVQHDYAQTAYEVGTPGYPMAITHFTEAIRLNPKSARSYMGRGLTYIMLHDQAHATPDLQQALIIDPNLSTELEQQVRGDYARLRDIAGAQQMLRNMEQLWRVDPTARTADQCSAHGGSVITGRCLVLNPPH